MVQPDLLADHDNFNDYDRLLENAIDVPGPETERLCHVAKQTGVFTVIGVNERNQEASGGSTLTVHDTALG